MSEIPLNAVGPNLIVGVLAVIMGILTVRHRRRLNDVIYKSQRTMFGRRAADVSAGRQTPLMMGVVGVGIVGIGVLMLGFGIVGLAQHLS